MYIYSKIVSKLVLNPSATVIRSCSTVIAPEKEHKSSFKIKDNEDKNNSNNLQHTEITGPILVIKTNL